MQTDDNLAGIVFLECMHDAVGDVCGDTTLRLHPDVHCRSRLRCLFQQLPSQGLVLLHVIVVEHHVQSDDAAVELHVAHERCQADQFVAVAMVFQRQQNLLVVALLFIVVDKVVLQHDALRGVFRDERRDDAREENHHHHAVEHVSVDQILAIADRQLEAHHDDGD